MNWSIGNKIWMGFGTALLLLLVIGVKQIHVSCQQQDSATEQIAVAMNQINAGMKQTVAAVEQTVASAVGLNDTAGRLKRLVG